MLTITDSTPSESGAGKVEYIGGFTPFAAASLDDAGRADVAGDVVGVGRDPEGVQLAGKFLAQTDRVISDDLAARGDQGQMITRGMRLNGVGIPGADRLPGIEGGEHASGVGLSHRVGLAEALLIRGAIEARSVGPAQGTRGSA